MGSPTTDSPAAPDGHARRSGQGEARRSSSAASHVNAAAEGPAAGTAAVHDTTAVEVDAAAAAAAANPVAPALKSAAAGAATTLAATTLAGQIAPLDAGVEAAAGSSCARAPSVIISGDPLSSVAGELLLIHVQEADKRAPHPPPDAMALSAEGDVAGSSPSGKNLRSMTTVGGAEEPKEYNNTGAASSSSQRSTAIRQRRSAGRQRPPPGTGGKVEADGGEGENPAAPTCTVVPPAGNTSSTTTRAGSTTSSASKREQDRVRKRYEPLLRETDEALQKIIAQGLPEADTLTNPQVYLELKRTILLEETPLSDEEGASVPGDEDAETSRDAESDSTTFSLSRVKRLLRALCEGSSLPLSKLIEAVRAVLLVETDGSPQENVTPAALQNLILVLLARRSLGIPPRRGMVGASSTDAKLNTCSADPEAGAVVLGCRRPAPVAAAATTAAATQATSSTSPTDADNGCSGIQPGKDNTTAAGSSHASVTAATADATAAAATAAQTAGEQGLSGVFSGSMAGFDRNEDTTPSCLWMWESAFLEGLPPAFKEKAKKDRDRRAMVSRRVRSLLRLQQAIEQGNEKEIVIAQEKVAALEKKQQQEEERRREQQLKKRRAEEARLEKEREKRQKEDAKREKEKEKKRTDEQQKQSQQQSAGGAARSQTPAAAKAEKAGQAQKAEKKKELPSSMLNQQLLMASWLTRKPLSLLSEKASRPSPSSGGDIGGDLKGSSRSTAARGDSSSSTGETSSDSRPGAESGVKSNAAGAGDVREGKDASGSSETGLKGRQASCFSNGVLPLRLAEGECFPWGKTRRKEAASEEEVVEVDGDAGSRKEALERKAKEAARARAAAEAALWRVPEGKRSQFVERVLNLPKALVPLPSSADAPIPFFDGPADAGAEACCGPDEYLKAFVESCAVPHSEAWRAFYSFFAINRQYVHRLLPGSGATQAHLYGNGGGGEGSAHTYCQEARDVRKGLALTDYADPSLPDLQYLRTAVINLEDWKRPVRRLLLGKVAGRSTPWEQCAEETCIDYDRDSDEEWFETFDVDDLDDGREEEEEEDQEAEEDKDWLVEDDDEVGGLRAGSALLSHGVRFESLCDWQWTFEGEDKPNYNEVPDACAVPTLRDPGWLSVYGCVADDWGGEPFAMLKAAVTPARRKLTDEDLCGFFRFCHGKIVSKVKLLAHFHKENRHLRKSDLEKKFKEHMAYERRPKDKQKRWYVSCRAAEALNLKEELDAILEAVRDEEAVREAAHSPSPDLAEECATDVAPPPTHQTQPGPPTSGAPQDNSNSKIKPDDARESAAPATVGSVKREECKKEAHAPLSEAEPGAEKICDSPKSLTSRRAELQKSSAPPATSSEQRVPPEEGAPSCKVPPSSGESTSLTRSVADLGGATSETRSILSTVSISTENGLSSAGTASREEYRGPTLRPAATTTKQDAAETGSAASTIVASNLVESDELKENRSAQEANYGSSGAAGRSDAIDTVDPFASAAATAASAASSAQAAAVAAREQRPAEFASATCVALAALTAAKLAKEVAEQMSGSCGASREFNAIVPSSLSYLQTSVCSGVAAPKSPCTQDNALRLPGAPREESVVSTQVQRAGYDVLRSSMNSTFESITRGPDEQLALATPVKAPPDMEATPSCQQCFPSDEKANAASPDADSAECNVADQRKRRRSEGSSRSSCGSSDGSLVTNKRTKRPSCPAGTAPASAGPHLKNALITQFFRVVPHASKRTQDDVGDEFS